MVTKKENSDVIYLNNASTCLLSPEVQLAGIASMQRPPWESRAAEDQTAIRELFSRIVGAPSGASDICLAPSTAFALTMAAENLARLRTTKQSTHLVMMLQDQFASAVYPFQKFCESCDNIKLDVVPYPDESSEKNATWTSLVLNRLNDETKEYLAVCLPPLHWSDGSLLDLKSIGQVCKRRGISFLVDATQAVGILPGVNVNEYDCSLLVCSMHKWLRCPMGMAFVYVNEEVQRTWLPLDQHARSRNHHGQGNEWDAPKHEMSPDGYTPEFVLDARKLDAGGRPNAQLLPIVRAALEQVVELDMEKAQNQLKGLMLPLVNWAEKRRWNGYASDADRCYHIVGIRPPGLSAQDMLGIAKRLQQDYGIYLAVKCSAFRVSPYLNNTSDDIECLMKALETVLDLER